VKQNKIVRAIKGVCIVSVIMLVISAVISVVIYLFSQAESLMDTVLYYTPRLFLYWIPFLIVGIILRFIFRGFKW